MISHWSCGLVKGRCRRGEEGSQVSVEELPAGVRSKTDSDKTKSWFRSAQQAYDNQRSCWQEGDAEVWLTRDPEINLGSFNRITIPPLVLTTLVIPRAQMVRSLHFTYPPVPPALSVSSLPYYPLGNSDFSSHKEQENLMLNHHPDS